MGVVRKLIICIVMGCAYVGCGRQEGQVNDANVWEADTYKNEAWEEVYICQTDYTQITYAEGYYYYQSEADHFYLYRSMEEGENQECLAEEVVKELYILDNWVYFTNLSEGSALYKVRADGGGMEAVCGEPIDRFFPIGEMFFCLSEAENGASRIFSCTADGKCKEIYEGKCDWLSTDGELLYAEVQTDDETQLQIIVMDKEGNVLQEYSYLNCFVPTKRALYYYIAEKNGEDYIRQIVRLDQETGEEVCHKVPEGQWKGCSYIVDNDKIYVLCYSSEKYTFFQYDEESNSFLPLCPCMDVAGEHTLFDKIDNGFYLVNGKIFFKVFVEDGKGELWHYIGLEERKVELFESMEIPVDVDISWQGVFRQNAFYREGYLDEDIVYSEDADDGQGYVRFTTITVPEISVEIPAAGIINQKIREDVEEFYKERNLFHESAREDDIELETSYGEFNCPFAYAGEQYVSIVYEKHLSTNSGYSGGWEYVTRLYSSKTGEELQPEALFSVSPERLFLGLSFLIRKTERGFDCFSDDLFYKGGISTYYRVYYCITSEGLDIFFVEDMRTDKEFHFLISYREMEDIIR